MAPVQPLLELDPHVGLTAAEAERRLAADGPNQLPGRGRRRLRDVLGGVLKEPMLLLLIAGAAVYLVFGEPLEATVMALLASLSVVITVVQEVRTERVLDRLRDLASPRALVVRDGVRQRIAGTEVVRGDLIILSEGDRVPADGFVLSAEDLRADESLLTGESVPVVKCAAGVDAPPARAGGDDQPWVYGGTLIVGGTGSARVTATGALSEMGRIGVSLRSIDPEPPRLRAQTARLVRFFGTLGIGVAVLAAVLQGMLRGDWYEGALAGIALGMAMLPEEFPVVLAVFMAMGAWRISRVRVLTRRAAAIETLGAATVLCTDKTGTLTGNRMAVRSLHVDGRHMPVADGTGLSREAASALDIGFLASAPQPVDPMDVAFHDLASRVASEDPGPRLLRAFGLTQTRLAVVQVWQDIPGRQTLAAAKGAPEAIFALCQLDADRAFTLRTAADAMAGKGERVLGLARASLAGDALPEDPASLAFEFVGLAGLADPLRPTARAAVADCHAAGIRVIMITGDYPVTAEAIARDAGLADGPVQRGADIAAMDDAHLRDIVAGGNVFARVAPDQKLRIIQALKARGEVVAMTGDGVNDAPSLSAAHVGIAMGGRGTDVAREAAGIVLLDDDFSAIVRAIRLGRRIHDNLRKALAFILSVHVPIAGVALMPLALGMPLVLGPLHIALMEMIIDPVCSLAFETEEEEPNVMRRPPRAPGAPLYDPRTVLQSALSGALVLAAAAWVYWYAALHGAPEDRMRAMTYLTLLLGILGLIFANRSFGVSPLSAFRRLSRAMVLVPVAVGAGVAGVFFTPFGRTTLGLGSLGHADLILSAGTAGAAFLGMFLLKALFARAALWSTG